MDQEPERTNRSIPRSERKHATHSKSTFPLPLRERARERGDKKPVSEANSSHQHSNYRRRLIHSPSDVGNQDY